MTTLNLSVRRLSVAVAGRTLVEGLDADFSGGDFVAVLGQNGAGKTLTLHTLAGLRAAAGGRIELRGRPVDALPRRQIAQEMALLPQLVDDLFPSRVFDTVLIGRHPHIDRLQLPSADDRELAWQALREMGLAELADRDITTLSGGERRRLAIAQSLAQTPGIYLLDEPTNHLDPQHQLAVCKLFARKARDGATVVAALHDVNLARRFATHALLLYGDGSWQLGSSADTLQATQLSKLFGVTMEAVPWHDSELFVAASAYGERPALDRIDAEQ